MKFFTAQVLYFLKQGSGRRNIRELLRLLFLLAVFVLLFSAIFQLLMAREGQQHSFWAGIYWSLVTMSTLGYGDIVFVSDLGRMFAVVVILFGMMSLLVVLPFTFIKFFYEPWMEAQAAARAPKELPEDTERHVILTNYDAVTRALIKRLSQYQHPYVLIVRDLGEALRLRDEDVSVVLGEPDNPETFQKVRVEKAALVVASCSDPLNTNIAFTVRELSETVPVIATAQREASVDILRLSGSSQVVQLAEMLGQSLARRTLGGDARAHIIGRFDQLLIAEATAAGTPMVGQTLRESRLREMLGINVVGVWERGNFEAPKPDTVIGPNTVMVLAGSAQQIRNYDELFCIYNLSSNPVVIIGGGRVGRATGRALQTRGVPFRIVEQQPDRIRNPEHYLLGNAADLDILEQAGMQAAPAVIITTHDDDTNIYLTILCRKLCPKIQIISRCTLERNISTLHRAGADFVMSYSSMGASAIFNVLRRSDLVMVAEGLNLFRVPISAKLAGRTIAESRIRSETGCSIVAVQTENSFQINPDPHTPLPREGETILIGSLESEAKFIETFGIPA